MSAHCDLFGRQPSQRARALDPAARGAEAEAEAEDAPEAQKARRRELREEQRRLLKDDPGRFKTTYQRHFPSYGANARPAKSTKADVHALVAVRMERSHQAEAEKEAEEAARRAQRDDRDLRFELTALAPVVKSEMRGVFVGGMPSSNWKSEFKSNFGVEVFSGSTNARYDQPTEAVAISKHGKLRLWGAL